MRDPNLNYYLQSPTITNDLNDQTHTLIVYEQNNMAPKKPFVYVMSVNLSSLSSHEQARRRHAASHVDPTLDRRQARPLIRYPDQTHGCSMFPLT